MTGIFRYARRKARIIICARRTGRMAGYGLCLLAALYAGPGIDGTARAAVQSISRPQVQTPQVQTPQVQPPAAPVPPQTVGGQARGPQPPDYSVPAPAQPMPALGGGNNSATGTAAAPVAPTPSGAPATAAASAPQTAESAEQRNNKALDAYGRGEYHQALELWRAAANAGDPQAMNNLGVLYDKGLGVEPDVGRALHWYAKSAEAGHPSGMCNFGRMLEQGRGIPQDVEEAARWFDLAARKGQPEAQYNLGMLYEQGHGVGKDDAAAAAWYSRAAAANQPNALARLGHFYREGRVVKKNLESATLLLYGAAMQGNTAAMKELEDMADAAAEHINNAVLFGLRLDGADRAAMRAALKQAGAVPEREKDGYICDVYKGEKLIPGADQMAICYGPGERQPLAFVSIDYPARDASFGKRVREMAEQRFGKPDAVEGEMSCLWNLGKVLVAVQYMPEKKIASLMYMIPRVYYLTQGH